MTQGRSLQDESFLAKLSPDELEALERQGQVYTYRQGEVLFYTGDPPDTLVALTKGRVKVSLLTEEGREVVLAVRGPGDLVGDLSAIDGDVRSATATAVEPVEAIAVSTESFRKYLIDHPRVAMDLVEMLARRLRDADRKRIEFASLNAEGRVASRLVELVERYGEASGDSYRISLPFSQTELAGWTGASREAVSKALHSLRRAGLIETHRRGISVLDVEGLRRQANQTS